MSFDFCFKFKINSACDQLSDNVTAASADWHMSFITKFFYFYRELLFYMIIFHYHSWNFHTCMSALDILRSLKLKKLFYTCLIYHFCLINHPTDRLNVFSDSTALQFVTWHLLIHQATVNVINCQLSNDVKYFHGSMATIASRYCV